LIVLLIVYYVNGQYIVGSLGWNLMKIWITNLDNYWKILSVRLPILSNIALDYIWLPISSCVVERSFSLYNSLLDSNRQSLSKESLKQLNMLYFN